MKVVLLQRDRRRLVAHARFVDDLGWLKPARADESLAVYKRRVAKTRRAAVYARGKRLVVASESHDGHTSHNGAYWSLIIPVDLEVLGNAVLDALALSGKRPRLEHLDRAFWDRLGPSPADRLIVDTKLVFVREVDKISVQGSTKVRGGWEAIGDEVVLPDRAPLALGRAVRDALPVIITRRWPV